jgi:hypothetical protein
LFREKFFGEMIHLNGFVANAPFLFGICKVEVGFFENFPCGSIHNDIRELEHFTFFGIKARCFCVEEKDALVVRKRRNGLHVVKDKKFVDN